MSNMNISQDDDREDEFLSSMRTWNTDSTNTGQLVDDPFLSMQGSDSNIMVSVRLRPESAKEKIERKTSTTVRVLDKNVLVFDPVDTSQDLHQRRALGLRRGKELRFAFDRVFDDTSTQLEVYQSTAKALLESVLEGYNATVFAYGATGAGKTFTMFGSEISGPGVLPLTIIDIFRMMEQKHDKTYRVAISFLEVYNENIHDLLVPHTGKAINHEIREDKVKGIIVSGLSEHVCENADQALELIQLGIANRTQYGTAANAQSSRSHAVFQINVQQTDRTANIQADVGIGKLSLIDLAGSERASVTKNRGARLVEGANINKSLLALSNCINALGKNKGKGYVPYRNSKLTRLLKDSLGGNCKTVMIANLSPSYSCYDDTFNTLKYANRAKSIKTVVKKNIHNVNFHISKYLKIIDELRTEIKELKTQAQIKEQEASYIDCKKNEQYEKERDSTEKLRSRLSEVFQEQMQNRRKLLELEEQDRQNSLQIMSIKNDIERWSREHPNEEKPLRIHTRQKDADTLIIAKREYVSNKEEIEKRLQDNISYTKSLQDNIPKMVSNNELRQLVDLQVKVHDQEILNLDLERMIEHHKSKVQRMSLILEDNQYCSVKVLEYVQDMYDRLRETNSLNPDIEKSYSMCTTLLDAIEKQSTLDHVNNAQSQQNSQSQPPPNIETDYDSMVEEALKTPKYLHNGIKKKRRSSLQFSSLFQLSFPNNPEERTVIKPSEFAANNSKPTSKGIRAKRPKDSRPPKSQSSVKYNNFFSEPIEGASSQQQPQIDSNSDKTISPQLSPQMSNLSLTDAIDSGEMNPSLTPDDDLMMDDGQEVLFLKRHTEPRDEETYQSPTKKGIDSLAQRHFSPLKKASAEGINALKEKFEKFRTDYMEAKSGEVKTRVRVKKINLSPTRETQPPLSPNQLKGARARKYDDSNPEKPQKPKSKKVKFEATIGDSPSSPKPVPGYMAYTQSAQHRIGATTASKKKPLVPPVSFNSDNDWILNLRSNKENNNGQSHSSSTSSLLLHPQPNPNIHHLTAKPRKSISLMHPQQQPNSPRTK
ncbi:kinesin-8 [Naegleria gruberi]|uniref:Kinesin-like protein KIN-8B n=1 Tax=Naegleria gruberi TaxID=5762 RepID=D2VLV4_NAEGR|nr:kinesin-8 [Naegleria gruberi]EFC42122.1 kinesin-8 [Naegleria gruberi]|eukprot:XP_002674866.1 kinesin-8 [Naegleria gruberi]